MKSGLPCVAYAVDGVMDLIVNGRNGYIAAPKDWETAANRLIELIHDENLRKTIGQAAQASVGPEFDIDNMVRRQEELYADLTL
jgi:glycosyltransferase involved in cell wall biosynthesis